MSYYKVLNEYERELGLDFQIKDQLDSVKLKQFDSYYFYVYFYVNGSPFNDTYNSDFRYFLRVRRPDKEVVFIEGYDYGNYRIEFEVGSNITSIIGLSYADVALYYNIDEDNEEPQYEINSTQPFPIEIIPSPGKDSTTNEESELVPTPTPSPSGGGTGNGLRAIVDSYTLYLLKDNEEIPEPDEAN